MLKSLVLGLLLANGAYFMWVHGPGAAPDVPVPPPVPTITLAAEAPAAARAAPEPAAATPPPAALPGGTAAAGVPATGAPASGSPAAGSPAVGAGHCLSVGPFRDVAEAAHAASTLRAGGYDPRQRVVDGDVWAGVWVYVPAPATAVEQLVAKLKGAGIDDALEMPGPTDGSVISLGLFSDQKRAQARVAQAQALGLSPQLTDRKRTGNVYWVDVDLKPGDGPLNPSDLGGESGHISRLELKACPAAAAS